MARPRVGCYQDGNTPVLIQRRSVLRSTASSREMPLMEMPSLDSRIASVNFACLLPCISNHADRLRIDR
jgi:hypothetical protein